MAASRRRSGNIKEEWQHPRRRGDKIKDFRVRLTRCVAMGTKHQLFGDIVAKIKDISETSKTVEKLLQYQIWPLQQGEKIRNYLPTKVHQHQRRISNIGGVAKEEWQYQCKVETSKKNQQHWRSGKRGMAISR